MSKKLFFKPKLYIHVDFYLSVSKRKLFLGLNLVLATVNCPGRKLVALTLKK